MMFLIAVGTMALFVLVYGYILIREEKKEREQKLRTA